MALADAMMLLGAAFSIATVGFRAGWVVLVAAGCWPLVRSLHAASDALRWMLRYVVAFSLALGLGLMSDRLEILMHIPAQVANFSWLAICTLPILLGYQYSDRSQTVRWLVCSMGLGLLVAAFSGAVGGADPMIAWLQSVFGWSLERAEIGTFIFRKSVHFIFYGVLSFSLARAALAAKLDFNIAARLAVIWAIGHSVFDEATQMSFDSRSGSFWDVLIDMSGAGVALFIVWLHWRSRQRQA